MVNALSCSKWDFLATGMALELASPLYPPLFLVLACMGSIARSITGDAVLLTHQILAPCQLCRRRHGGCISHQDKAVHSRSAYLRIQPTDSVPNPAIIPYLFRDCEIAEKNRIISPERGVVTAGGWEGVYLIEIKFVDP